MACAVLFAAFAAELSKHRRIEFRRYSQP